MSKETPKPLCVLTDWPLGDGFERDILERSLMREGIHANQILWLSTLTERPQSGEILRTSADALAKRRSHIEADLCDKRPTVVLSMGNYSTEWLTGKSGIDKWHSSVLDSVLTGLAGTKVIPCFPTERIKQDLSLQLWLSICARKAKREIESPNREQTKRVYLLNPSLEETLNFLNGPCRAASHLSIDIETGRGQINTVGFAVSPHQAIAINVLPDRLGAAGHYELWQAIRALVEGDQPKVLQNFIYEAQFFSRYGIRLNNVSHDTMIAQKFLYPEFPMGLDAIGRMYSEMSYWKEDGKSWNNIRDWEAHYAYNCKDTTGTFEGYLGQCKELRERGLADLHDNYIKRLYPAITEMCSWGIPLSEARLTELRNEVRGDLALVREELNALPGADSLNPRSPTQVKEFLIRPPRKYAIPKKYDSATKRYKESTDEKSIKKLRLKHPDDAALTLLLKHSKLGKADSSYLNFKYDADCRMRFSLNAHGTETGRFSGSTDPWDNGVNPQTVPGGGKGINIKSVFEASPGYTLFQCDLRQAESRFVAYDSADLNLINALEDPTRDIHSEVAMEILIALGGNVADKDNPSLWKKRWRQLGKKSGHGANYSMKEATFQDSVISEMDLVLSKTEANKVLEAYHRLFPGIRQWHASIRKELAQTRTLRTPLGRVRQFWGRLDDDMFRQAYAYRPQSTIPDITNHLMLYLLELREQGKFDFRLLLQCHDSLLLEVPDEYANEIALTCLSTKEWHPVVDLPGGRLIIPTECEVGRNWGNLVKWGENHVAS